MTQAIKAFLEADALLPCPFCGDSHYVYIIEPEADEPQDSWHIGCIAQMEGGCGFASDFTTRDYAVKAWNNRTPDLAKMVEDMLVAKEALEEAIKSHDNLYMAHFNNQEWCDHDLAIIPAKLALTRLKPYEKLFGKEGER